MTPSSSYAVERLARQLAGLERWHAYRVAQLAVADGHGPGREEQLDAARRRDALDRTHLVVVEQAGAVLRSGSVPAAGTRTAVVAHPRPWLAERMAACLEEAGLVVLACESNGADALGRLVAEQPDLLVTHASLAMLSGAQVAAATRHLSPETTVVALGPGQGRQDCLDAGAHAVCPREDPRDVLTCSLAALERPLS